MQTATIKEASANASQRKGAFSNITISLIWKILLSTLIAGLLPLALVSFSALNGFESASTKAREVATKLLDDKSLRVLQLRAEEAASAIANFLNERVKDTKLVAQVPRTEEAFVTFYESSHAEIWLNTGTVAAPVEERKQIPLYREIAFIDRSGKEVIRIKDGNVMSGSDLRDVSKPENTTYLTEDYFAQTKALRRGDVYVSHVMAWHASIDKQTGGDITDKDQPENIKYRDYEAVIRFGTPVYNDQDEFIGIVLLSLDHRHIMEFTQHIMPADDIEVPYPDYKAGNYSFVFDNEGYTISHPTLDRIRGLDASGNLIPGATAREQLPTHPFRAQDSAWADPNYPTIFKDILQNHKGYVDATNLQNVARRVTYAPIPFSYGVYRNADYPTGGFFGGVVIGTSRDDFNRATDEVRQKVAEQREIVTQNVVLIGGAALALLVFMSALITSSITRPLFRLTAAAQTLERGELDTKTLSSIIGQRFKDEVTKLAQVFKQMADQVQMREQKLKLQVKELNIQIDEAKKSKEVAAIVDSEYFQELRASASTMRQRIKSKPNLPVETDTATPPTEGGKDDKPL